MLPILKAKNIIYLNITENKTKYNTYSYYTIIYHAAILYVLIVYSYSKMYKTHTLADNITVHTTKLFMKVHHIKYLRNKKIF